MATSMLILFIIYCEHTIVRILFILASMSALCKDPKHPASSLFFCKNCAVAQRVTDAFFCELCSPQHKTKHKLHAHERKSLATDQFKFYSQFKEKLIFHARKEFIEAYKRRYPQTEGKMTAKQYKTIYQDTITRQSKQCYKNALLESTDKLNPKVELADENYRKWLVARQFWLLKPWEQPEIKKEVLDHLLYLIDPNQRKNDLPKLIDMSQIKFSGSAGAEEYHKQMQNLRGRVEELAKEKQLGEIFARVTSHYTNEQIEQGLRQITVLEGQYKQGHFLFQLARLKTSQLHTQASIMLKQFLSDPRISNKTDRQKQLHHYFMATSHWQVVEEGSQDIETTRVFYEIRNKRYYKLTNPHGYIDSLSKAIEISKKPLYYACRALGYMITGDHQRAQFDFQQAQRLRFVSDAMNSNRTFNNIARKKQLDRSRLRQSLADMSVEHVLNMCRHLKKVKDYQHLKLCCLELVGRQPDNISFRLRLFNAFFKLGDKDNAKEELSTIKNENELDQDEILECQRKIQLLKARENEQYGNLYDSEQKYRRVAEMGDQSPTAWYNYATFLFNHRQEMQRNEQALKAINTAIELQPKQKYYQLKYLLLFVAGNMEEAKDMHTLIEDEEGRFKAMREYLIDNT